MFKIMGKCDLMSPFLCVCVRVRVCVRDVSAGEQPDLARALSGVLRVQDVVASAQQLLHQEQRDLL